MTPPARPSSDICLITDLYSPGESEIILLFGSTFSVISFRAIKGVIRGFMGSVLSTAYSSELIERLNKSTYSTKSTSQPI